MRLLFTISLIVAFDTLVLCQTLSVANSERKAEMFSLAFDNQSTSPSFLVFTAVDSNNNESKEICTLSTTLWWALAIENNFKVNIDSLGNSYANTRIINFVDTSALIKLNFKTYNPEILDKIQSELTDHEKSLIAQYYNPNHFKEHLRLEKKYYCKLTEEGEKYFNANLDMVVDSLVAKYLKVFQYDIIFGYKLDLMKIPLNEIQQTEIKSFRSNWLNLKNEIDLKYYLKNPDAKYMKHFGIYYIHYLFNHGILVGQDCLGGLY